MNFSNLDGVVCQEIVPDELEILGFSEESEDFPVVVQELLLRWDSATTKLLLQELKEFLVLLWGDWYLRGLKCIIRACLGVALRLVEVL